MIQLISWKGGPWLKHEKNNLCIQLIIQSDSSRFYYGIPQYDFPNSNFKPDECFDYVHVRNMVSVRMGLKKILVALHE